MTVLVRTNSAEGLNYLEFYVGKRKKGAIVSDDLYIFLTGSSMVDTFRTLFNSLIDKNISNIRRYKATIELLSSDPAKGIARVKTLPADLRDSQNTQMSVILAASNLDEKTHADAIDNYRRLFPDDPSVDLVSIDGFFLRKKFSEALAAIDRLEKGVDGDPFLDQIRASIVLEQGTDFVRAAKLARSAIKAEPGDENSYLLLLVAELGAKNYPGAVEAMTRLTEKFELMYSDELLPELTENHKELMQSDAWAAYKAKFLSGKEASAVE